MPAKGLQVKSTNKISMTVRLPRSIYDQARKVVESGVTNLDSMNELVIAAVGSFVKASRRRQIDLAFREMAKDGEFQNEANRIAAEFEASDWEALRLGEKL
jgi:hypothetical protein